MDTKVNTDGIIYIPQSDTYRIRVGKRTIEVLAWKLKRTWNISRIEDILRGNNDNLKNDILDSIIIRAGGRLVDDLGSYTNVCGNDYVSSYDQIDALYRGPIDPANTIVACMDIPEPKPYYDPSAAPTVYYNDRFPSMSASSIIDEAIELLNAKKNLHVTKLSLDQIFNGYMLLIHSDRLFIQGLDKTLTVIVKHAAFDRAQRTDIDMYAGLKAKLDTDTYIKLRIAFLLYEAVTKIDEWNKEKINSDIFEVINCNIK